MDKQILSITKDSMANLIIEQLNVLANTLPDSLMVHFHKIKNGRNSMVKSKSDSKIVNNKTLHNSTTIYYRENLK